MAHQQALILKCSCMPLMMLSFVLLSTTAGSDHDLSSLALYQTLFREKHVISITKVHCIVFGAK